MLWQLNGKLTNVILFVLYKNKHYIQIKTSCIALILILVVILYKIAKHILS